MNFPSKFIYSLGALAISAFCSYQLKADSVYTGTLTDPATVVQENFSLSSPTDVSIFTTSYGGGTNLDGTTTPAGGFQPNITLYKSNGSYVDSQAITDPMAKTDPKTGLALDGYLKESDLAAGSYIVTLTNFWTQQPPTATNLSDGFVNYGGSTFADAQGNVRTGSYALNISTAAAPAATPEPATFWLVLPGLVGAASLMRKRRSSVS